jgi:hypothetical protein
VRVLRRDLDQLIADADALSRVQDPTSGAEGDRGEVWLDAGQFWGAA